MTRDHIRLLSFNIQNGIQAERFRHYLTRAWQHVLPDGGRLQNLDRIASVLADHDVIALQEADGGSLRSGFINQVEYLADAAGVENHYQQRNRDLGYFGAHGNGLLARTPWQQLEDHRLPGANGRGAIVARFDHFTLISVHLSLTPRARRRQLTYVRDLIDERLPVVIMGDMNASHEAVVHDSALADLDLHAAPTSRPTYPSWQPMMTLDHVLVSPGIDILRSDVVPCRLSDHLPVSVDIAIREPGNRAQRPPRRAARRPSFRDRLRALRAA